MGTLQRFPTTSNHDSKTSNYMSTRIAQPSTVNRFANISTLRHTTFELFSSYGHEIKDLVHGPINKDLSNNTPLDSGMYLNSFSVGEKTTPLIDKAPFTKMSSGQPYQRRRNRLILPQKNTTTSSEDEPKTLSICNDDLKRAFMSNRNTSLSINDAFLDVPHPTPTTLSRDTVDTLRKLNSSRLDYEEYEEKHNHIDYSFMLPHPLPWKNENGQLCCVVCCMLVKQVFYQSGDNFKIFRQKGANIDEGRQTILVNMYGESFQNLLGGRMCDKHYRQVLKAKNKRRPSMQMAQTETTPKKLEKRKRRTPTLSIVTNSDTSDSFSSQYSDDDTSDDDIETIVTVTPKRSSKRLKQKKELLSNFKKLIEEERSPEENIESFRVLRDASSHDASSENGSSTGYSELPKRKKKKSPTIHSRHLNGEDISIVVIPEQNSIEAQPCSSPSSGVNNSCDYFEPSILAPSTADHSAVVVDSVPILNCVTIEEQQKLYQDFLEYDETSGCEDCSQDKSAGKPHNGLGHLVSLMEELVSTNDAKIIVDQTTHRPHSTNSNSLTSTFIQ